MIKLEMVVPDDQIEIKGDDSEENKDKEDSDKNKKESAEKEGQSAIKKRSGFEAGSILKAPLEQPTAKAKPRPIQGQLRSLILGFALVIIALFAWPIFGYRVAVAVVLVGATFISMGALVRI